MNRPSPSSVIQKSKLLGTSHFVCGNRTCNALLIVGALHVLLPQTKWDVPSSLLFWITLLGEGLFIGNVIWSYVHGEPEVPLLPVMPDAKTTAEHVPDDSAK